MKIRTLEDLQQVLDEELAWRKKELVIVKSLVTARSSKEVIDCHIRAGITLLYAHWEGFIKVAGTAYLTYVASQRLTYLELTDNFVALSAKKILNEASDSSKVSAHLTMTRFFISGLKDRCTLPTEIETKSNLSSEVLKEIVFSLGFDYYDYEINAKIIDEVLLKNRNFVAHGKYLIMDVREFIDLHSAVVALIDLFANQVSNAAAMEAYRRT